MGVLTPLPWMLKVPVVAPEGTVAVAGTFATLLDDETVRVTPPAGAGWFRLTTPLVTTPEPIIVYGESVSPVTEIGLLSAAKSTPLTDAAVMFTLCDRGE